MLREVPTHNDYCMAGRDYILQHKLPHMLSKLEATRSDHFLGSGHQIILGVLPALVDTFRYSAKFVRLRRSRLDVAYSYYKKGSGPCAHRCILCLCPLDPATRCPVSSAVWGTLSVFQRYLWFVDEVECQWQTLLTSRPWLADISHEVHWTKAISFKEMNDVGVFSGLVDEGLPAPEEEVKKSNEHVHSSSRNWTWIEEQDADYRQKLGLKHCNEFHCIQPSGG